MSDKKELSEVEIASKIRAGKPFQVQTERERKRVLTGAKYQGITLITRIADEKSPQGPFNIIFTKS